MPYLSEPERLTQYYDFDHDVVERVGEVADRMRLQTWGDISEKLPQLKTFDSPGNKSAEVLDIRPIEYDETQVYHLPMGNTLDPNMSLRIAALAEAEPNKRIIVVGNPGSPRHGKGKTKVSDFPTIWKGDLRPAIDSTLRYLDSESIDTVSHIGFSYGADRAITAAQYANSYDQQVPQSVLMEPASVKSRNLIKLTTDFGSTASVLEGYVKSADLPATDEAIKLSAEQSHGVAGYIVGLARLSNIAIAHALARGSFEKRTDLALTAQPEMQADIIWGSESELAINGLVQNLTQRLIDKYGLDRVRGTVLEGQKHAMGDDVFLHTALVLQGLKNKS